MEYLTYEETKTYIENWVESPTLAGIDQMYKSGMIQGFIHGAEWAQTQSFEQLQTLLKQVETLQAEVEKLKSPKE